MMTIGRARAFAAAVLVMLALAGAQAYAADVYHCYFGNTHSHTAYSDGGGTPADHFGMAKAAGYDFYAVTDHALARYTRFTAQSYEDTKQQAGKFTDSTFVGIAGFEFSENDGPGGTGHLTVLNSAGCLDATGKSVNLPVFYDWLVTNQTTTVAAAFNHPAPNTYNAFDYLTPSRRDAVTMYEMINSGVPRYDGYIAALEKGWRVAPIAAEDGHGTGRIKNDQYRTGVLAPSLTRENILQAMRSRRVYCTWDKNLHLSFSANGEMMGSALTSPTSLDFRVTLSDPDISDANDRITKVEIVGQNGAVVATKDFSAHSLTWATTCSPQFRYYFVKAYAADKANGPTAYSAPVWVEGVE